MSYDPFATNDPFATAYDSSDPWGSPEPTERKPTEAERFESAKANLLAALKTGPVDLPKAWSIADTTQPMVQSVIAHLRQSGVIEDYQPTWGPSQIALTGSVPSKARRTQAPDPRDPFA